MRLMIVSREISGLPLQFIVMNENRRCSILFHFEVPGGKWHTSTSSPVSSTNFCSSIFHRRGRLPVEPPQSAGIVRREAGGERPQPRCPPPRRSAPPPDPAVAAPTR